MTFLPRYYLQRLKNMNKFDKVLDTINGLSKVVPGIFKDASGNLSSKRTFKLLGGGFLMTAGVTLFNESQGFDHKFWGGLVCIIGSMVGAYILKTPDPDIKK